MSRRIYAIKDTLANDIVGPLWLLGHDAVAVRTFGDVASQTNNAVGAHLEDHELHCLGALTDDLQIFPLDIVVITGRAWAAAQQKPTDQLSLTEEK